jgi:hypothetical protein
MTPPICHLHRRQKEGTFSVRQPVSGCRLWNLWEIMKLFKAREFVFLILDFQQYMEDCDAGKRAATGASLTAALTRLMPDGFVASILGKWKEALALCEDIKLENAAKALRLSILHLENTKDQADYSSLGADFRQLFDAICTDFWTRKFIQIPEEHGRYVNSDDLMGPEVKTAFPSAASDIREAGNCLAVDCGTAAVFYLMRAVEWGLRSFCAHLGIKNIKKSKKPGDKRLVPIAYSQWERILEDARGRVDAKIDKLRPGKTKQEAQEFYYPLLQDLRGFKDAWRNHVMHTRAVYTVKDSEAIMDHVKGFLERLSTKVSE